MILGTWNKLNDETYLSVEREALEGMASDPLKRPLNKLEKHDFFLPFQYVPEGKPNLNQPWKEGRSIELCYPSVSSLVSSSKLSGFRSAHEATQTFT